MYEIWFQSGRTRKVVARFRLLSDARKYLGQHPDESLEIRPDEEAQRARRSGSQRKSTSPESGPPRRTSGVRGRVLPSAAEHPDEFIADRVDEATEKASSD
jgi:hypothetical protein